MELLVRILIVVSTVALGILALTGKATKNDPTGVKRRPTWSGWLSIVFLILSLGAGIVNEAIEVKQQDVLTQKVDNIESYLKKMYQLGTISGALQAQGNLKIEENDILSEYSRVKRSGREWNTPKLLEDYDSLKDELENASVLAE